MTDPEDVSGLYDGLSGTQVRRDGNAATLVVHRLGLEVVEGVDRGATATIKGTRIRVGSGPECDLVLSDAEVSRLHFEVRTETERYEILDLESTNGTFVQGVRVFRATLEPGEEIRIGDTTLLFEPKKRWESLKAVEVDEVHGLVGASEKMRALFGVLKRVAPTELSVLVTGETGTGKEVAARAIHRASPRNAGTFLAVDCAAISPALAESELFGHVRGAFTGAERDRAGVFEAASGGVVFLDEVGEIATELQPKLLRALERREVRRVGSNETIGFDVRILAATHRDLPQRVRDGEFREDLYFRLAEVTLTVPPLRERLSDLPLLAEHLLTREGTELRLHAAAFARLAKHGFPGNVRELRNTLRRAAAFATGREIGEKDIDVALRDAYARSDPGGFADLLGTPYREARKLAIERFERAYVEGLIRDGGSITAAARRAQIHRKSLERLIRKLEVEPFE